MKNIIPRKAEFEHIAYFPLIYYSNHSRRRTIMQPLGEKIRLDFILRNGHGLYLRDNEFLGH